MTQPRFDRFFGGGRGVGKKAKAAVGEVYGPTDVSRIDEETPKKPKVNAKAQNGKQPKSRGGMGIGM